MNSARDAESYLYAVCVSFSTHPHTRMRQPLHEQDTLTAESYFHLILTVTVDCGERGHSGMSRTQQDQPPTVSPSLSAPQHCQGLVYCLRACLGLSALTSACARTLPLFQTSGPPLRPPPPDRRTRRCLQAVSGRTASSTPASTPCRCALQVGCLRVGESMKRRPLLNRSR